MSIELISILAGVAGVLIGAAALKSRSAMARKANEAESRTEAIKQSQEKRDEVDALDPDDLIGRAADWVRHRKG